MEVVDSLGILLLDLSLRLEELISIISILLLMTLNTHNAHKVVCRVTQFRASKIDTSEIVNC